MTDPVAFALKAGYDLDSVGAVFVHNNKSVDVRDELGDADGVFVTADPPTIAVLDTYQALKRVTVPAEPVTPPDDGLGELTKAKLLDLPDAAAIDGAKSMNVDDLRAAIRAHRSQEN